MKSLSLFIFVVLLLSGCQRDKACPPSAPKEAAPIVAAPPPPPAQPVGLDLSLHETWDAAEKGPVPVFSKGTTFGLLAFTPPIITADNPEGRHPCVLVGTWVFHVRDPRPRIYEGASWPSVANIHVNGNELSYPDCGGKPALDVKQVHTFHGTLTADPKTFGGRFRLDLDEMPVPLPTPKTQN